MGKLDYALGYLSGPMEYVADHGAEWRRKFIHLIYEAGLDIDLIDPTNKPGEEQKVGEDKGYQTRLKQEHRWKELADYVGEYRRYDLRYVDYSDFLVVVVDPRVPQWGTSNEVYFAEMQHKPTFFICDGGLANLPNWLFDLLDFENDQPINVFQSIEEVVEILRKLDLGEKGLSKEWVLARKYIEQNRQNRLALANRISRPK